MIRQELEEAYARLSHGLAQSEPAGLRLLRKTLEEILAPGELRETMLRGVDQTIAAGGDQSLIENLQNDVVLDNVREIGDEVHVEVMQTADSIRIDTEGHYGTHGEEHLLEATLYFQDTWTKIDGRWYLSSTHPIREILRVDGELWNPQETISVPEPDSERESDKEPR